MRLIAMRNVPSLLIILVGTILYYVNLLRADLDNGWSPTELPDECGKVPAFGEPTQDSEPFGTGRILYGDDAVLGEWPWIVQLVAAVEGEHSNKCSGSLINSRWVLTAGHCAERVSEPRYWKATFGLYNVDERDYIATDTLIDEIIVHPNYTNLNNDVALFHLNKPIGYNKYIQPVCLINSNEDVVGYTQRKTCFTLGYGYTTGMRHASKLQKLKVVAHPDSFCLANWSRKKSRVRTGAVCVGPNNPELIGATCRGDSGGPNVCFNEEKTRWEQFGVVSYGPSTCDRDEGDKWLTAVADLTHYVNWIQDNTKVNDGS